MKPWFTKFTRAAWSLAYGCLLALPTAALQAQGVTTGSMSGTVRSDKGAVAAARVVAVHQPSGTTYQAVSRADGRFLIPAMRVGGPYTVTAVALGYERTAQNGLDVTLGSSTDVSFELKTVAVTLTGVQVTATGGALSSRVTAASTTISKDAIAAFPTIGRTITDFTRLTPQSSGSSFAGQDVLGVAVELDHRAGGEGERALPAVGWRWQRPAGDHCWQSKHVE